MLSLKRSGPFSILLKDWVWWDEPKNCRYADDTALYGFTLASPAVTACEFISRANYAA